MSASREEPGITEFRQRWPLVQDRYAQLTEEVTVLCRKWMVQQKIPGHVEQRPDSVKTLESIVGTLEKKVKKEKKFPTYQSVIEELDDLSGVAITTTKESSWKAVTEWIEETFDEVKPRKIWQGDREVYGSYQPRFQNYTAIHFKVALKEDSPQNEPRLVVEIQLKTEDTASSNRVFHPVLYKGIKLLTDRRKARLDAMAGLANVNQQLKEIELDEQEDQFKPFSEAWNVMQVLEEYGFEKSQLKLLPAIWLALQVASVDQPQALDNLCTSYKSKETHSPLRRQSLFGPDWGIIGELRKCCDGMIESTRDALPNNTPQGDRYHAWILGNALVFLYCWGMKGVIGSYLHSCSTGISVEIGFHNLSALLAFLSPTCNPEPSEEQRRRMRDFWEIALNETGMLCAAINLVEIGVYPTVKPSKTDWDGWIHQLDYFNSFVQGDFLPIVWPAVFGRPPEDETFSHQGRPEPSGGNQDEKMVFLPRVRLDIPNEDQKGRLWDLFLNPWLHDGDPKINWVLFQKVDLSGVWDCTTPENTHSLDEIQYAITAYCKDVADISSNADLVLDSQEMVRGTPVYNPDDNSDGEYFEDPPQDVGMN